MHILRFHIVPASHPYSLPLHGSNVHLILLRRAATDTGDNVGSQQLLLLTSLQSSLELLIYSALGECSRDGYESSPVA